MNIQSKSSITEEFLTNKYIITASKRDSALESNAEKPFRNEFTMFNKITNIFTEPIREIIYEEATVKTNQTIDNEDTSPIHFLMAELRAKSKPKKPSKQF